MKVVKHNGQIERDIAIGMVVSTPVVAKLASTWDKKKGNFKSKWTNVVGGWAVDHYEKYGKAPGKSIQSLFTAWAEEGADKDTVQLVETFLDGLSGEYVAKKKEVNANYLVDQAGDYFTRVRLERLRDDLDAELDAGKLKRALKLLDKPVEVKVGQNRILNVLSAYDVLDAAFAAKKDPLIRLPGAVGNFFGDDLRRDAFIALEGPEKRGKTWWLLWMAWIAMLQKRRVLFFEVGDLSEEDMMLRFAVKAARRPFESTLDGDEGPVLYPTYIEPVQSLEVTLPKVDHDERHFKKPMSKKVAKDGLKKMLGKVGRDDLLRLYTCPNYTINMNGVKSVIQEEARRGWLVDVVFVDYMDILAPIYGAEMSRDQVNANWMVAKQISQLFHCLVVTASQTNAASYSAETLDMTHFSEDKRKRAHTTGTVGINQTDEEKAREIYRLNWQARRHHKYDRRKSVHCAACLAIANPCVISTF